MTPPSLPRALTLGLSLVLAGCTSPAREDVAYEPRFERADCSPLADAVLLEHSCGYLVVPEDRSDPTGRQVHVYVVTIHPPGNDPAADPVVRVGVGDIGEIAFPGNVAATAQRVNRVLYVMDQRGAGGSEPDLRCPEVARVEWQLRPIPSSDPSYASTLLRAVRACHDRLVADGVDLAAYNLAEMASDVEDLRRALGIDTWNIAANGDSSRIALEVMRRFPEHVRSVILDSPEFPADEGFGTAAKSTRQMLAEVDRVCAAQPACAAAFPHVSRTLEQTAGELQARPLRLRTVAHGREPIGLALDGALFVRLIRLYAGEAWQRVPALVYDGHERRFELPQDLGPFHPTCFGYSHICNWGEWNIGLFYSELCHDELPFVATTRAQPPGLDEAFVHHLYLDVCRAWRVGRSDPPDPVIRSDIPTIVFLGRFDPYITRSAVEDAMAGLTSGFLVTSPTMGSTLMAYECPATIRNAWIEHPRQPPDASCVEDQPPPSFIAPVARQEGGAFADLPNGRYRVRIAPRDALGSHLDPSQRFTYTRSTLSLTLDRGRFRIHRAGGRAREDQIGWYTGQGTNLTFVLEEPFLVAGMSWDVTWRAAGDTLIFEGTEMSSKEDATFFSHPAFLGWIQMWMEAHPWRRI